jgi:hypothetical protein
VHNWNIFGARTSHEQTWIHKTHHDLDLGEATTFSLIVYSVPGHTTNTQMSFFSRDSQVAVLKFPKLGLLRLWRLITLCEDLRLKWGVKQTCSPCWELSNGMWYATFTQGRQGDSWLLVVESQIGNLTPGLSLGHNLCFNYPNGSCKPILDIYVLKAFQWFKELFNPMGFDPYNWSLKIQESIGTPTPKVGVHLGVWRFIPSPSREHEIWLPGFTLGLHLHKPLLWLQAQG